MCGQPTPIRMRLLRRCKAEFGSDETFCESEKDAISLIYVDTLQDSKSDAGNDAGILMRATVGSWHP
jgi:hypothetical protein